MKVTPPEYVKAVMNLIESGDVSWDDSDVVKEVREAIRRQSLKGSQQDRLKSLNESRNDAPSARLTLTERARISQIRLELVREGITAERWELKALTRGAMVIFNGKQFSYPLLDECLGFGGKV
ncbi:hypothetical protein [Serratia fonticola]|uniref:hypothetical protein n=1 Tax=Serratia fonticola TaxID=47917 RepID=UPI0016448CB6|nr:hypothetical protein [Serratia fonticola]MBC3229169.1 hypothetical protein [Serratia fonticola]